MSALDNLDPQQQHVVRANVRGLLQESDAYAELDPEQRKQLANGLVNVVAYLSDPKAGQDEPVAAALAEGDPSGAEKTFDRLAGEQDTAQKGFEASAGREGAELYEDMANAVDFPAFVAGLIDGVFNSIVKASIQQMEAYGQLLAQVAKSVDEFAKDNFTLNQGRDWLAGRFPNQLSIDTAGPSPRLVPTDAGEESGLADVRQTLGIESDVDLDDETSEAELARRAQLEMARLRQKQLATMVLMGINRIVVTDGLINAKVVIDVRTTDRAKRTATASAHDDKTTTRHSGSGGGWFSDGYELENEKHKTIVTSAVDDTSESMAEAKAKLTGEVRVNFKSETFPLDKLASQTQLESVNERAAQ